MSIPLGTIDLFRSQWATRFADEVTIKEITGTSFNDTTGQTEPTYTNRYVGAYLWRDEGGRDIDYGEQEAEIRRGTLHVPYTVDGIAPGMVADLTSATDEDLDGLQVIVRQIRKDTYNTVRKLICEENQSD